MLTHLADVSLRSLLLAAPAGLLLRIIRGKRTAALQHAIWTAVICGMLALLLFGQVLPRLPLHLLGAPAAQQASAAASAALPSADRFLSFETIQPSTAAPAQSRSIHWQDILLYSYFAVALAFLIHFMTGMFLARKLVASARLVLRGDGVPVYESAAVMVPVTIGWLRPRIVLPHEWRDWNREKLDAVLAHEGAHVRRRDTLAAALAGFNRCLFWFHPLAWFLERRGALLAEQACDDCCVATLGDPGRYARLLLEMASVVGRSQGRLRHHALTMAAASHIRLRIDALVREGRTFSRGLTGTAWASLLLCGVPLVLCAGAVQLDRRPPVLSIDMPRWTPPAPSLSETPRAPIQIAQKQIATPAAPLPPAVTPKFDSVSVKPCAAGDGAGHPGRGGEGGRGIPLSPPGELYIHCLSVFELLGYTVQFGDMSLLNDPLTLNDTQRVRGGPPWIYTDLYTIDAKTSDPAASTWTATGRSPQTKMFNGTMVMAMLAERFHLTTHRVIEEVPMYSLTLAPGGLKAQPMEEGSCIPYEPGAPVLVKNMFPAGQKPLCIQHGGWEGPNWTIDAAGQHLSNLTAMLAGLIVDRPVLDKTGITGQYNYHIKFAHDQAAPGMFPPGMNPFAAVPAGTPAAPSINTVLENDLGLTLVPDKGPREFIVIDSAERPSVN